MVTLTACAWWLTTGRRGISPTSQTNLASECFSLLFTLKRMASLCISSCFDQWAHSGVGRKKKTTSLLLLLSPPSGPLWCWLFWEVTLTVSTTCWRRVPCQMLRTRGAAQLCTEGWVKHTRPHCVAVRSWQGYLAAAQNPYETNWWVKCKWYINQ